MTPAQFWQIETQNQQNQQAQQLQNQKLIYDGLMQLGGAIKGVQDEKTMLGAMDSGVGLMTDLGAITPDTRDMFMNADKKQKPLLFELLQKGAFSPFAAGQSAGFQAKAWDNYRASGGGGGGGGMSAPSGFFTY